MSVEVVGGSNLYKALKAVEFPLPEECGDVALVMPVDGVMTIRYTVFVAGKDLVKLAKALELLGTGQTVRSGHGSGDATTRELRASLDATLGAAKQTWPLEGGGV